MKKLLLTVLFLFFILVIGKAIADKYASDRRKASLPLLVHNFVDIDKIEKISKFRSCQGHTVIPVDESESKRSMKHYFVVKPEFQKENGVPLYAPYDARVAAILSFPDEGLEGEIWLDGGSDWQFSIEHINLVKDLKWGSKVHAGDLLGYAARGNFDVVYAISADHTKVIDGYTSPFAALGSVFSHMSDSVFAEYQKYGIDDRSGLIYTKDFRDANPCKYRGDGQGGLNDIEHPEDWVFLSSP